MLPWSVGTPAAVFPALPERMQALGLHWRPADPASVADTSFVRKLFASTRERELQALGASSPLAQQWLDMQCTARDRAYSTAWPGAVQRVVEHVDGDGDGDGAAQAMGLVWVATDPALVHVLDVALLPAWRGRGLGCALLQALLMQAQLDHKPVMLQVRTDNPAVRLYGRLGFKAVASNELDFTMRWTPAPIPATTCPITTRNGDPLCTSVISLPALAPAL